MDLSNDVIFVDGQDNMGGIKKLAYIGFVGDFTTIQTPADSPATYADKITISEAHVLASGKKTIALYVMYDKSGVESPTAGGRKQKSFKPKVTLMYPGNDAEIIGFTSIIKNADMLVFVEPMDGGDFIQIGSADLPATVDTATVKTGNAPDGEKGVTFDIVAPSNDPYYIYTAAIPRVGS